ncbi:transposase [Rhodohalobacter mucosus]|uniref:Transposase n=1 Tax=Rhodohalobacter mucosus TaxID=2079485 RepID=A0A316U1L5_9BACT|nr:transposase [Rhodohalobacter mucosus]PWN06866.1 transposase [Rhodohalobacter mucosus]
MKAKKVLPDRRSIRLQGYDYSNPGEYFVTICTQNRECVFGDVVKHKMALNEIGDIARYYWYRIPERYDDVVIDAFVVMPNHVHGIIGIEYNPVRDAHSAGINKPDGANQSVGAIHELPLPEMPQRDNMSPPGVATDFETYRKQRRQMLLSKIIGWYKMNVAKRANMLLHNSGNRFWQRNYYEHIIRDEQSLNRIREYIVSNPERWDDDMNHPENINPKP